MKRTTWLVISWLMVMLTSTAALAFSLSDVKGWFGIQAVSYILTGILSVGAIGGGMLFLRLVNTLKEAGEFVVCVTTALADRKISSDEIKQIVAQAKDVFDVWKATPKEFKTK